MLPLVEYFDIYDGDDLIMTFDILQAGDWQFELRFNGLVCVHRSQIITIDDYDLNEELDHILLNATGDCNNGSIDLELNEFFSPLQYSWFNGERLHRISQDSQKASTRDSTT